ncbi:MAG TPA: DUF397 domain-containing protein [Actinophytocola sp.]|uniref:DUF397 domain-containing protein n=1 Tax=Actinophytocola sp. TaxID=1872138 RepID=UPI002DDD8D94|nr:DUF397 domain-containing protein [Actinophytocola sp.]HEV2781957.1 DUF397 domain-containing protein [Actinophytocola sp.]
MTSEAITMSTVDISRLVWRKSRRSGQGNESNCVEVAFAGVAVAVRDSKSPKAGALAFPSASWHRFLRRG